MMKARIFDIKRFAVHDGDGIRTTVFFKGCPLKCIWCHNPEGIGFEPRLAFYANKCVSCGDCVKSCPQNAHSIKDGIHTFEREKCILCGKCESVCLRDALTLYGKETTADELMPLLLADKSFYESSGGGVTLSGGECLSQADFCCELLQKLKAEGINTAVDTCGYIPQSAIDKVIPYTDTVLYDIKAFDEDVHIKCTGHSNKTILENLKYIDGCRKNIEIRIPYVPGFNDNQIEKIARFLADLKSITKIRILPYHNYAGSKYTALDMPNTLPDILPAEEDLASAKETIKRITQKEVND